MSLAYLHGPNISISIPTTARQESQRRKMGGERRRWKQKPRGERLEDVVLLALKMEERAVSQGVQVPPEAGKGKNRNSTLEPPEGTQSCKHLDSNPVRTILRL